MLGIIFAALIGLTLMSIYQYEVHVAFAATIPFLWYWHLAWCIVDSTIVLIALCLPSSTLDRFVLRNRGGQKLAIPQYRFLMAKALFRCVLFSLFLLLGIYTFGTAITMRDGVILPESHWNIGQFLIGLSVYMAATIMFARSGFVKISC